ncbi:MAG: aminotransferase class III-fold pyridoxal phosphate-dependent enzyme, partial [Bacteroidetes bacterium]|nr:aminotransferase class III-fold pyridoxal phosphate-dependent enzyme [Bacteroidota bacterium]
MNSTTIFEQLLAHTTLSPAGIEVDKVEDVFIIDKAGKKYIDLISGLAVLNLGHQNRSILKAVKEQLDKYMHVTVYGEYLLEPQLKLAEKLVGLLPEHLNNVFFTTSG